MLASESELQDIMEEESPQFTPETYAIPPLIALKEQR